MLRPLRRRLRLIRYYSAAREQTAWTRAADAALFITLALALPAALLCDVIVARPSVAIEQDGMLDQRESGRVVAQLADPGSPHRWSPDTLGRFTLEVTQESRGWPMATSTITRPARLQYELYHEPQKRFDVGEEKDSPMREAIAAALARDGRSQLLDSWRSAAPVRRSEPPLRWFLGAGLWWIMLYVAAMLCLGAARLVAAAWEKHRKKALARRRHAGLCPYCGYDLRGTEFSERCPECGEFAH